ncbi:MAG: RNA 2'-phosphotransferase [Gemmataceae bacterium]
MNEKRRKTFSRFLSKHLRHAPEEIGIELQPGGWVDVDAMLMACQKHGVSMTREELDIVVRDNEKQRFAFDDTRTRIRANQGHSVDVDLQLLPTVPPTTLYHGTATRFVDSIERHGLLKQSRQHVHLSAELETAITVGRRHGQPFIFEVDCQAMLNDGFVFYLAANGVWLTDHVPSKYLSASSRNREWA